MKSWIEFEQRFRELAAELPYIRLDHQWGAAGEYWRLAGSPENASTQRFELLCSHAGEAIFKALKKPASNIEHMLCKERNHLYRWYRALEEWSGGFKIVNYGIQTDENGEPAGTIFIGEIEDPVLRSANLCFKLHAEYPIPEKTVWRYIWDNRAKVLLALLIAGLGGLLAIATAALSSLASYLWSFLF
jgi:hypothetical protein